VWSVIPCRGFGELVLYGVGDAVTLDGTASLEIEVDDDIAPLIDLRLATCRSTDPLSASAYPAI